VSKRRRSPFSFFDDFFKEFDEIFEKLESGAFAAEGSGGYSITVTYDNTGRPVVHVETHGDVDKEALRREIEEKYPGARIVGLEGEERRIRFIDEEEEEKRKPLVREVDVSSEEDRKDKRERGFRIRVE